MVAADPFLMNQVTYSGPTGGDRHQVLDRFSWARLREGCRGAASGRCHGCELQCMLSELADLHVVFLGKGR
jgi:hypothetical protein